MKRILTLVITILVALSCFAGCSKSTDKNDSGTTPTPTGKQLRKVKMVFPRTVEALEDTPYWVAKNLGYWEEEGLDVTIEQSFGTTDIKMIATGNAEFACPGPSFILAGIEEGLPIKVVSSYDAINIWGMAVLKSSKIQSFNDMKDAVNKYGKKLTVALGDASWEMLVTPTLVAAGVDPKKDLEFVVAGENRYIQVNEGKLDMLFTWPGECWQLMGQGFNFNYIDGNEVLKTNSNSIITNTDLIKNEPEVVQGFVRGLAKGIYFTKINPEAAAAVSCKQWPNINVTRKAAVYVQKGRAYQMFGPEGGSEEANLLANIGKSWDDKWQLNVDTAVSSGVIKAPIALDKIFTNQFNDLSWDKKKVETDAANYDVQSVKSKYKPE